MRSACSRLLPRAPVGEADDAVQRSRVDCETVTGSGLASRIVAAGLVWPAGSVCQGVFLSVDAAGRMGF